jgi:hypothetical protein
MFICGPMMAMCVPLSRAFSSTAGTGAFQGNVASGESRVTMIACASRLPDSVFRTVAAHPLQLTLEMRLVVADKSITAC